MTACTCSKDPHELGCPEQKPAKEILEMCRGMRQPDIGENMAGASAFIENRLGELLAAVRADRTPKLPTDKAFTEAVQVLRAALVHGAAAWHNASQEPQQEAEKRFMDALETVLSRLRG